MSTGKPHLPLVQCVALADEWAALGRRSGKWLWLVGAYVDWQSQEGTLLKTQDRTTPLHLFLNQRHAFSHGWNRAYCSAWVTKFNDFYLFVLTTRIAG